MIKLTYPAGITRELYDLGLRGIKLNGIRPIKIEINVDVKKNEYDELISKCVCQINQYCGQVFYLGSMVWGKK